MDQELASGSDAAADPAHKNRQSAKRAIKLAVAQAMEHAAKPQNSTNAGRQQALQDVVRDDGARLGEATTEDSVVREDAGNRLSNLKNAQIDPNKIKGYALDPNHPVGGNKAKVFNSALGYNQSNADQLISQVRQKLPNSEAVLGLKDQYGQRFTVDMLITGPNGNTATVRTGWIFDEGSYVPRLTTIFIK